MANRPKVSNKLGIPTPGDGSDGDIQVRQTNLGAKLFGKIGGRWHSTFLSGEEEIIGTSGTAISMSSSGTLSVKEIELTGKITLSSRGTQNVCIGTGNADIGQNNVSIGVDSGKALETGATQNICIGSSAGEAITTGDHNVLIGFGAGALVTGLQNVCIGSTAGNSIAAANDNTVIGFNAGSAITSGTGNVCIGKLAQSTSNISNGIAIGALADASGAYGIAIGIGTSAAAYDCVIGKSGAGNYITVNFDADATWDYSSDLRMKRNIQDDTLGLSFINDLKTKTFQWKPSEEFPEEWENYTIDENGNKVYPEMHDRVMHGMIAQEVKEALDTAGIDTFAGWKEDEKGIQQLGTAAFVHPLIKAVQELSTKIDAMQVEINNLT